MGVPLGSLRSLRAVAVAETVTVTVARAHAFSARGVSVVAVGGSGRRAAAVLVGYCCCCPGVVSIFLRVWVFGVASLLLQHRTEYT